MRRSAFSSLPGSRLARAALLAGALTLAAALVPTGVASAETATTTTLVSSQNPSQAGAQVTYTATVSPPPDGGTVTFTDGTDTIPGCSGQTLIGDTATCQVTYSTAGSHAITAAYSGESLFYGPSTSSTLTQTVEASTTTTLSSSVNPSQAGQAVTFTATVSPVPPATGNPTGTVAFSDGTDAIPGCVGQTLIGDTATCQVAYTTAGSHAITAAYSGDSFYLASTSSTLTQTVEASTTTTLSSSVNPSPSGQGVVFTATVSENAPAIGTPAGTVTFSDNGTPLGTAVLNGNATVAITTGSNGIPALAAGSQSITATYNGDLNDNPSTSATLTQTVTAKADTTTVVASSANPSPSGQGVVFTATVSENAPAIGTPAGTVTFSDNGTPLGTAVLNGNATVAITTGSNGIPALAAGSQSITATYNGDLNDNPSTSATLTQTVTAKADTTTVVASSANPSPSGQGVVFTATVSENAPAIGTPAGTVTFSDNGTPLGTAVLNGNATVAITTGSNGIPALAAGSQSITATYNGDLNDNPSTSATLTQTVTAKADTTTVVASSANPSPSGQGVVFTATVSENAPAIGTPAGTVTFSDNGTPLGTAVLNGNATVAITTGSNGIPALAAGSQSITATYNGDLNDNPSTSATLTQTVSKIVTTAAIASSATPSIPGQAVTYTATVSPTDGGGSVAFDNGGTPVAGCAAQSLNSSGQATCQVTYTATGSHVITAVYSGDAAYAGSTSAALTQNVVPDRADLKVGLSVPAQAGDGASVTETVIVTNQGPAPASKVITALTEPSGLTVTNAGGASVNGPLLTWTTASLAPGASETFTVTVQVGTHAHGAVLVAAGTLSATPDPDLLNNAAVGQIRLG